MEEQKLEFDHLFKSVVVRRENYFVVGEVQLSQRIANVYHIAEITRHNVITVQEQCLQMWAVGHHFKDLLNALLLQRQHRYQAEVGPSSQIFDQLHLVEWSYQPWFKLVVGQV